MSGIKLADIVHDVLSYDTRANSKQIVNESKAEIKRYNRIYSLFSALFVHDRNNYDRFLSLYDVPVQRVCEIVHATNELLTDIEPSCTPEELRRELNIEPDQSVVLFLGTLSKYKGVDTLVRAFPAIHKATGARLVIAGFPAKDVDIGALRSLSKELGADDQTSWFLDYVPNERISPFMAISDFAVYPYNMITQSGAMQLAYAFGKPVVATRVGGLPDVVDEGKNGLLVPPQGPQALAEAINKIFTEQEMKQCMGQHSKMLAETRYSWQLVAGKMKSVFQSLTQ